MAAAKKTSQNRKKEIIGSSFLPSVRSGATTPTPGLLFLLSNSALICVVVQEPLFGLARLYPGRRRIVCNSSQHCSPSECSLLHRGYRSFLDPVPPPAFNWRIKDFDQNLRAAELLLMQQIRSKCFHTQATAISVQTAEDCGAASTRSWMTAHP